MMATTIKVNLNNGRMLKHSKLIIDSHGKSGGS